MRSTGSDLSRYQHPVLTPEYPEAAIVSMSGWSTTAVPNIYTSPSQTGWSARNQGEDWPVFSPSQPMQALAIVRVTAGVGAKKKLSAKTPVEESKFAAWTTPNGVGVLKDSSQSASTPTEIVYIRSRW